LHLLLFINVYREKKERKKKSMSFLAIKIFTKILFFYFILSRFGFKIDELNGKRERRLQMFSELQVRFYKIICRSFRNF
jgi:hypothetical protein